MSHIVKYKYKNDVNNHIIHKDIIFSNIYKNSKLESDKSNYVLEELHNLKYNINKKSINNIDINGGRDNGKIHEWYKYNTFDELINDKILNKQFKNDMYDGRNTMLFDWTEIQKISNTLITDTHEHIGVIRAKNDKKTLYIHKMEKIIPEKVTSTNLMQKYSDIPCYFLFQTRLDDGSDPFPTNNDILLSCLNSLNNKIIGHIILSKYGIIIYYLTTDHIDKFDTNTKYLGGLTCIYAIISVWNAFVIGTSWKWHERLHSLRKYNMIMTILATPMYISDDVLTIMHPDPKTNIDIIVRDKATSTIMSYIVNEIKILKSKHMV